MNRFNRLSILMLLVFAGSASTALAQNQYIGYVYPAGGQQGATFPIRLGGQRLANVSEIVISGEGVTARLVDYYRVMSNQEISLLRKQLTALKKKGSTVGDVMAAKMAFFEFPASVEPPEVRGVVCKACGRLNPLEATVCSNCNANLEKPKASAPGKTTARKNAPKSENEVAKLNMIERIQRRFAEDQRNAAVRAHTEIIFAEVTIEPNAKPGRREIRIITKLGISNAMSFYVGQVPEVARKAMKTARKPVLGKEQQAQRKRPASEEEMHITTPCTMNGQIAAGEVNRYRFQASKGQRLLISARARQLVPYVADGVPGWFQAVLRIHDAKGKELAYNDDFRFRPDPTLYFEVPADGDYVVSINDAIFRGRESFVYRITIGELPFVTSIFPLGGRVGKPVKLEMHGWNLEKTTLVPPSKDAKPGRHMLSATRGKLISNYVPFALDTLPECLDKEPNNDPSKAQKVTLPIIVNGRSDRPGDWDVFEVQGKAGETIVAEVHARRLGSPFDSFVKITSADGKIIALNDDHYDAGSGLNTDHADSYLMVKLPASGKYFVHIGDTRRQSGKEYAYRLRISRPRPNFALRLVPSRIVIRSKSSVGVTVYAIRKDGFTGPIKLGFKDLPKGLTSNGVTLPAKKDATRLTLKTSLTEMDRAVNLTILGAAKIGSREIVHAGVPTEDRMQAFLWRHLAPAETLPALVYNRSYRRPTDRIRPPILAANRPKGVKRTLKKSSVDWYLRQIEGLYQDWFLTDEFANREVASIEARLIK